MSRTRSRLAGTAHADLSRAAYRKSRVVLGKYGNKISPAGTAENVPGCNPGCIPSSRKYLGANQPHFVVRVFGRACPSNQHDNFLLCPLTSPIPTKEAHRLSANLCTSIHRSDFLAQCIDRSRKYLEAPGRDCIPRTISQAGVDLDNI
jgi:hypothetical protein